MKMMIPSPSTETTQYGYEQPRVEAVYINIGHCVLTGMLPVLADTAVTSAHVTTLLAVLRKTGRLLIHKTYLQQQRCVRGPIK